MSDFVDVHLYTCNYTQKKESVKKKLNAYGLEEDGKYSVISSMCTI